MRWMSFACGWAGVAASGLLWPQLPALGPWPLLLLGLGSFALVVVGHRTRQAPAGVALALLAGAVGGVASFTAAGAETLRHRWPAALERIPTIVEGCVVGVPEVSPGRLRFDLRPLSGAEPARLIRFSWYRSNALPAPGERWRVSAKLRAPRGLVNPGSGDYSLGLLQAGIDATGSVRTGERLPVGECANRWPGWQGFVDPWRLRLATRLTQAAGPQAPASGTGLLLALALGFQESIPDADWRVFSRTGLSHLVAISGLHVTLFAALVVGASRWVQGRGRRVPSAGLGPWVMMAAVAAATLYAMLAGGNLPAMRTAGMLAIAVAVRQLHRQADANAGVALAWSVSLWATLFLDPFAAASLGCWLSYGAVGVLLWSGSAQPVVGYKTHWPTAAETSRWRPRGIPRWRRETVGFLQVQGVVTLALAPVLAASVGLPAWVSLPANAVAIPLFSFVLVPAALLATLLVAVWPAAGNWYVPPLVEGLDELVRALHACLSVPGSGWSPAAPSLAVAVVITLLAVAGVAPVMPWRWRIAAITGALIALCWPRAAFPRGEFSLTVFDVGQGSAAVVETARHVVVFDPGPAYGPEADAGGRVVVPYLRSRGWISVDAVVVSHADADHSAGLEAVSGQWPDAVVWWGGDGGAALHGRHPCRAGLEWHFDGVGFRFLHPGSVAERDDNSGSCVLEVSTGQRRALLLADIPKEIEERLVEDGARPADLVLVAHHGSATASSEALRTVTRVPEGGYALISAGYRNRWNFPRPAVVAGWRKAGRTVLVTAEKGALRCRFSPRGVLVEGVRSTTPRWWRPAAG